MLIKYILLFTQWCKWGLPVASLCLWQIGDIVCMRGEWLSVARMARGADWQQRICLSDWPMSCLNGYQSKSHSLKESTPQRRTVRSIEVVTVNSDKRCFSFIYLSVCGTKTSYYSPYGLWEDPGDALVCGPSFVSVTSKVYGCHHIPVNKRWMSHISQLAVWTHRDDSQSLKLTKLFIFEYWGLFFFFLICTLFGSTCTDFPNT